MTRRRSRFAPAVSAVDTTLESRVVLSGGVSHPGAAEVAGGAIARAATGTTLTASAGTLGQPVTFTVTVRAPASAGAPQGAVNLLDRGRVFQTLTLSPAPSTDARFAASTASYTLTPRPGDASPFFGRHPVVAEFVPAGGFARSRAARAFTVSAPPYAALADGVKVATVAEGSGPAVQPGQTASVLYTGYLAGSGKVFDDSARAGGAPFRFTLGSGQVIPGFDEGAAGMKVGETRVVEIPPAQGYGSTPSGSIPAGSTLIFVLTLDAVS